MSWWRKRLTPRQKLAQQGEIGVPVIYQHCALNIGWCEDHTCAHAWEAQSQAWVGVIHEVNTWLFVDYCRSCDGVRVRRVFETQSEELRDREVARMASLEPYVITAADLA